jgi:hypothetical protein
VDDFVWLLAGTPTTAAVWKNFNFISNLIHQTSPSPIEIQKFTGWRMEMETPLKHLCLGSVAELQCTAATEVPH